MPFLMSDVASGSNAAMTMMQNMAAAPNIQQEAQLQLQQDQAKVEALKLSNLATDSGLKATQDAKAKLASLAADPKFKAADDSSKIRMMALASGETGDVKSMASGFAAAEAMDLKEVQTQLKQQEANGLVIGSAFAAIKDASPEKMPEMLNSMSPEQHKAIEAQIPNFFKENDPKLQKAQLEALFENTSGRNLLATSQLRTQIVDMQNKQKEEHDRAMKEIAELKRGSGAGTKETALELREWGSFQRKTSSIDNSNKKELKELEDAWKEADRKDSTKTGVIFRSTAKESAGTDKDKLAGLESTKAWNAYQQKKKEVLQEKLDALESLPEGKEKDRLFDVLQRQLDATDLGPETKAASKAAPDTKAAPAKPDATSNKLTAEQQATVSKAEAAIKAGADPQKVKERLKQAGIPGY